MRRSFTRRARVAYYLAWPPMAALVAVVLNLRGHPWIEAVILGISLCTPYALICGASYYMANALPLRRTRLAQVLPGLVGASALAGGLWAGVAYGLALVLPDAIGQRLYLQLEVLFGIGVGYFALSLVFHYLILTLEEARRIEVREKEARVLKREAELRALKFQVNPHFMFNSLNAIAALTSSEPEQARRMCLLLSDFLRASLQMGDRQSVSLREELDLVRGYLEVERVRFQERLQVRENVEEECLGAQFPPLLLQPLVENAIKHGVAGLEDGGEITLEVRRDSDRLCVAVENPFDPAIESQPGSGRGLGIVEDRIRAFAGKEARMVISKTENRFRVEIRMPAGDESQ